MVFDNNIAIATALQYMIVYELSPTPFGAELIELPRGLKHQMEEEDVEENVEVA